MTRNEKAVAQLNSKDSVGGKLDNDTVYLVVGESEYELADYEIAYQARMFDEENQEEL